MKQYTFVDWDLVRSTPLKHTYRCAWRELLLGGRYYRALGRSLRRYFTIEWNATDQLSVRSGRLLPSKERWSTDQLKGITFGLRELGSSQRVDSTQPSWLWFIHLNGKGAGGPLAELLIAHQHDAPTTTRARVPARVQELLNWLHNCTGHRPHGPILVTDEESRRRILSHVETK